MNLELTDMQGLGTVVNVIAIIVAGIIGCFFGNKIPERIKETLMTANAVAILFLGIGGVVAQMLKLEDGAFTTQGTIMMVVSLAVGAIIGELFNIEGKFETFGEWLKQKTGNAKDLSFVNAFVTCSLTICIGAMAVVGSIEDGMYANHSILFAKAIMDSVIVLVMASSMGRGTIFSAIPVFILQGCITLLARLIKPIMTDNAMANLSLVGSALIFCVGVNLFWGKKVRVANLLPALVIAVIWAFLPMGRM